MDVQRKLKYLEKHQKKKKDFINDNGKVDFSVIRYETATLGLMNNGKNVCFFNSVMQFLYLLPLFRDYINQLQTVEEVTMQIKNLFQETETSMSL